MTIKMKKEYKHFEYHGDDMDHDLTEFMNDLRERKKNVRLVNVIGSLGEGLVPDYFKLIAIAEYDEE